VSTPQHAEARPDWVSHLRHVWSAYFNGSATPQFVGTLVLAIGIGILIGIAPSGSAPSTTTPTTIAEMQAEQRSILHIEELSARSRALEDQYSKK
jgi:hypothetical protein